MKALLSYLKWIFIIISLLAISLVLFTVFEVIPRIKTKGEAYHNSTMVSYQSFLKDVGPEAQFEKHTCGLHTLRVIYKAYGLNPDDENLRFRLGVDIKANPIDEESTGTLQPDMLRVLLQDGFMYTILPIKEEKKATIKLLNHLEKGNMAAILISRRENGNMHWVAAQKKINGKIAILDSLFPEPYLEEPHSYTRECILSCILLEPNPPNEVYPEQELWDGSRALYQTMKRYTTVTKYRAQQSGGGNSE